MLKITVSYCCAEDRIAVCPFGVRETQTHRVIEEGRGGVAFLVFQLGSLHGPRQTRTEKGRGAGRGGEGRQ